MADFRKVEFILVDAFRRTKGFEIREFGDVFAQRKAMCVMAQAGETCGELVPPINLTALAKAIADEV